MSGTDLLVAAINGAMPRAGGMPPVVGVVTSVGGDRNGVFCRVTGVVAGTLDIPQKWFSSWFLSEVNAALQAQMGGLNGVRVLIIFTEGNQPVVLTTLATGP